MFIELELHIHDALVGVRCGSAKWIVADSERNIAGFRGTLSYRH